MRLKILLLVIIFCNVLYSENIGSLFLGSNIFVGSNEFPPYPYPYEVDPGFTAGFLLPINFPFVDSHYKVRVANQPASWNRPWKVSSLRYISATNVFLIGKEFPLSLQSLSVLPQLGFGLIYENIYQKWGDGYLYNLLFFDFSFWFKYSISSHKIGILLNFEKGAFTTVPGYKPKNRLNISLVYSI